MTATAPIPLSDGLRSMVDAPDHWRMIDFISDLHLHASQLATFLAWQHYMAITPADAVFILGDLFEVWVGDDAANTLAEQPQTFEARCQRVLANASSRLSLFFMHGNRDFLLGSAFAQTCGMTLLEDPAVLAFDGQRWLLSHGDALCLDDTDYQQFRALVRSDAWRASFLAKPLAQRQALARSLRDQSESRKTSGARYADVDTAMALYWLDNARTSTLIHGHTHRPADHLLNPAEHNPIYRRVLSDWDAEASPPRLEVLRLNSGQGPKRISLVP